MQYSGKQAFHGVVSPGCSYQETQQDRRGGHAVAPVRKFLRIKSRRRAKSPANAEIAHSPETHDHATRGTAISRILTFPLPTTMSNTDEGDVLSRDPCNRSR